MAKQFYVFNSFNESVSISEYNFMNLLAKHSDDLIILHVDLRYDDFPFPEHFDLESDDTPFPFVDHIDYYYAKGHEGIPFISSVEREYLV